MAASVGTEPFMVLTQQAKETERSEEEFLKEGRRLYSAGLFAEAATSFQAAAETYTSQGDFANQALSLSYGSLAFQELSQWQAAEDAIATSLSLLESNAVAEPILWAHALNTKASLQLSTGKAEDAIATWDNAHQYYERANDAQGALGTQINQAQAWQKLGFYRRTRTLLTGLTQQINSTPNSVLKLRGLHSLGIAYQKLGDFEASRQALEQSLAIAQAEKISSSPILLSLGSTMHGLEQTQAALKLFQQAAQVATQPREQIDAQLNELSLYLELEEQQQAMQLVPELYRQISRLPPSRHAVYSAVNFANAALVWEVGRSPISSDALLQLLEQAAANATQLQDGQAAAHTLVQQGKLYRHRGQVHKAIASTEKGLARAQGMRATDITAQAAAQLGRLQVQQGNRRLAIASYRQATQALQQLRSDLATVSSEVQFSFRESVEPTYRELVALLLDEEQPSQTDLIEARTLIEALQLAELDNFFREACADLQPVQIDQIDPTSAVVYSIILPERTALIVSRPQQPLRYYSISNAQADVESQIDAFLESLSLAYDSNTQLQRSQKMYDLLIRSAEADQALAGVETLVFVLDGELRNIPMAALHDGTQYLIEKYRLALSPGLQLLAPRPLADTKLSAITGGVSRAHQGFSALPAVTSELKQLAQNLPSTALLNQDFTRPKLAQRIAEEPASIVHLATHGQFSSNASETFLLTWEGRLNIQDLSTLLSRQGTQNSQAIELLVLSACQTAAGDDKAVLGLAGFAVRSGARATLATLWSVRDQSTAAFMRQFYQSLKTPGITKAEALRQAQLSLLSESDYDAPFFWAPFILVGNWL
ncbi:MAG: CHAT domain-containing protein [Cyanobacteria bacterium P01_A01_bin.17]